MKKKELNPKQLATLYYIYFNISEESPKNADKLIALIDPILEAHDEPGYNTLIPDEDGAPINASGSTYDAIQELFLSETEDRDQDEFAPDLEHLFSKENPTWLHITSFLKDL